MFLRPSGPQTKAVMIYSSGLRGLKLWEFWYVAVCSLTMGNAGFGRSAVPHIQPY